MKYTAKKTLFPREPRHAFDFKAMLEMHKAITALLRLQIVNGSSSQGSVLFSESNATIVLPAGGGGDVEIAGEWDPEQKYPKKPGVKTSIVFFTPDGESGGTFYSLQPVPAGISPDTGAPYWADFPSAPPGIW